MTKQFTATVAAALVALSASAAFAQTAKPTMHKPMKHMAAKPMNHPMMAAKTVYVCKQCQEYFSPNDAKKMGYKDSMGHTLTKVAKVPAGYMDGTKSKM